VFPVDHEVGDCHSSLTGFEQEFGLDVTSLFSVCVIAMIAVFILLGLLALLMELITTVFPYVRGLTDTAVVAAITTTVASVYPGARVTRIEEET
jgi:hypothetical protein